MGERWRCDIGLVAIGQPLIWAVGGQAGGGVLALPPAAFVRTRTAINMRLADAQVKAAGRSPLFHVRRFIGSAHGAPNIPVGDTSLFRCVGGECANGQIVRCYVLERARELTNLCPAVGRG